MIYGNTSLCYLIILLISMWNLLTTTVNESEYYHILVDIEFIKLSKGKLKKIIDCKVNIQFYIISLF